MMGEGAVRAAADDPEFRRRAFRPEVRPDDIGELGLGHSSPDGRKGRLHRAVGDARARLEPLVLALVLAQAQDADRIGRERVLGSRKRAEQQEREIRPHGFVERDPLRPGRPDIGQRRLERGVRAVLVGPGVKRDAGVPS